MALADRARDTERFYELLSHLEKRVGGKQTLDEFPIEIAPPLKGIYLFFESGEIRSNDAGALRVVRVGMSGGGASSHTSIWIRLFQHKMATVRSNFSDHIYAALKNRTFDENRRVYRGQITRRDVIDYIGKMPFLWVRVDEYRTRKSIERNAIRLLSDYHDQAVDKQSQIWLGKHRVDPERPHKNETRLAKSGLWNVDHVTRYMYAHEFLDDLEACIDLMYKIDSSLGKNLQSAR